MLERTHLWILLPYWMTLAPCKLRYLPISILTPTSTTVGSNMDPKQHLKGIRRLYHWMLPPSQRQWKFCTPKPASNLLQAYNYTYDETVIMGEVRSCSPHHQPVSSTTSLSFCQHSVIRNLWLSILTLCKVPLPWCTPSSGLKLIKRRLANPSMGARVTLQLG